LKSIRKIKHLSEVDLHQLFERKYQIDYSSTKRVYLTKLRVVFRHKSDFPIEFPIRIKIKTYKNTLRLEIKLSLKKLWIMTLFLSISIFAVFYAVYGNIATFFISILVGLIGHFIFWSRIRGAFDLFVRNILRKNP